MSSLLNGLAVLKSTFATLYDARRDTLHALTARITGDDIRTSWIEVSAAGKMSLIFLSDGCREQKTQRERRQENETA